MITASSVFARKARRPHHSFQKNCTDDSLRSFSDHRSCQTTVYNAELGILLFSAFGRSEIRCC
jgi:hypothetical protein